MTEKLPPDDSWDRTLQSQLDHEADVVSKRTRAEVDASLSSKGIDPAAVRAKGEALVAKLKAAAAAKAERAAPPSSAPPPPHASEPGPAAPAPPQPPAPAPAPAPEKAPQRSRGEATPSATVRAARRWNNVLTLGAVALAAAILLLVLRRPPGPDTHLALATDAARPPVSSGPAAPSPQELAATLRRDALAACAKQQWYDCRDKLDDAWRIDPDGEKETRVAAARAAAEHAIEDQIRNDNAKR